MTVTIDTNILLHLLRETYLVPKIREVLDNLGAEDTITLSIVSVGEIESIAHQRNYGKKKRDYIKKLIKDFLVVLIESLDLVDRYAEIDAYSQGKLKGDSLPNRLSSRNMGKMIYGSPQRHLLQILPYFLPTRTLNTSMGYISTSSILIRPNE